MKIHYLWFPSKNNSPILPEKLVYTHIYIYIYLILANFCENKFISITPLPFIFR